MDTILIILSLIVAILGIIGSMLPTIPGPPLSFLSLILAKLSGLIVISDKTAWIMFGIGIFVMIFDFISPSIITKKFGGSTLASNLSLVGMIVGMIFFPPFGVILGSFLGAFIGELIHNRKADHALKIATLSFIAFLVTTGIKLIYAVVAIFIIIKELLIKI